MIYLDNAATTRVRSEIIPIITTILQETYSNPSSVHTFGLESEKIVSESRKKIAELLGIDEHELYFTPSGTVSNNIAIQGIMNKSFSKELIVSSIEHSSVFNTAKAYMDSKKVLFAPVDRHGFIDTNFLKNTISESTALVSIMQVNNEIGTIQNIEYIGHLIKEINPKTLFHVDGVQGFGKIPIDLKRYKVDLYSISGHKIHAPKGIGALFIDHKVSLNPILFGGGQEGGLYPGTENVASIAGFAEAAHLIFNAENTERIKELNNVLITGLQDIEGICFNTPVMQASPYIVNVGLKDIRSEVLIHHLEQDEIYISAGSACNKNQKSRVVEAIGVEKEYEDGCIRISLSNETTEEELNYFIKELKNRVGEMRSIFRKKRG